MKSQGICSAQDYFKTIFHWHKLMKEQFLTELRNVLVTKAFELAMDKIENKYYHKTINNMYFVINGYSHQPTSKTYLCSNFVKKQDE